VSDAPPAPALEDRALGPNTPHHDLPRIDRTERATAQLHLERMEREGRVERRDDGRWRAF
jgi:hypothetical protein